MNQLTVTVPITLPDGYEIIKTENREQLEADQQVVWDLNKAVEVTGYTKKDLTTILRAFKKRLDVDNGGCVFYPYHGGKYSIESSQFTQFIRKNFAEITRVLKG